jgi:hypothetical protein
LPDIGVVGPFDGALDDNNDLHLLRHDRHPEATVGDYLVDTSVCSDGNAHLPYTRRSLRCPHLYFPGFGRAGSHFRRRKGIVQGRHPLRKVLPSY